MNTPGHVLGLPAALSLARYNRFPGRMGTLCDAAALKAEALKLVSGRLRFAGSGWQQSSAVNDAEQSAVIRNAGRASRPSRLGLASPVNGLHSRRSARPASQFSPPRSALPIAQLGIGRPEWRGLPSLFLGSVCSRFYRARRPTFNAFQLS